MAKGCAPGKVILFGEHAVVYGRPALAVPVSDVRAEVTVEDRVGSPGVMIHARDIARTIEASSAAPDEPLSLTVRNALSALGTELDDVCLSLSICSSIPVASGMGSGAAVAAAMVRALGQHLGQALPEEVISAIVYETERVHHGTPSGIDNTVVVYERPVYFCRGQPVETLRVERPFWLAIADTGLRSPTSVTVGDVRAAWQRASERYECLFDQIGAVVGAAREAIQKGRIELLGPLMDQNQRLLRELDVSAPALEALIDAAHGAGAWGAKLSGGGRGGNAMALIGPQEVGRLRQALLSAGAKQVVVTKVG